MDGSKYTRKGLLIRILMFLLWVGVLVFIVDGLGYFPVLEEKLGYVLTEGLLLLLVIIPLYIVIVYASKYLRRR